MGDINAEGAMHKPRQYSKSHHEEQKQPHKLLLFVKFGKIWASCLEQSVAIVIDNAHCVECPEIVTPSVFDILVKCTWLFFLLGTFISAFQYTLIKFHNLLCLGWRWRLQKLFF